jgi:uncharacterized protein
MKCPNCEETLIMTERQGVEIDYCPKCRGVWLDKGELDKIIEKSNGDMRQQNTDNRNISRFDDDDDNFGRRNAGERRRGGFLGNLFDFD